MLMIYNKEVAEAQDEFLSKTIDKFKQHYPVVFSHVSHYPVGSRTYEIKKNDVLIRGFAEFATNSVHNSLLVLFEYGDGVNESKQLIKQLGIEDKVIWLPLMSRKKIMVLLEYTDFGGAEFGGAIWGGTGWEFMAKGIPFFQYVDMSDEEFEQKTGMTMPPFFNVKSSDVLAEQLVRQTVNRQVLKQSEDSLRSWFNTHAGESLAQKYIDLIKQ